MYTLIRLFQDVFFFLKIRSLDGHGTRYFKENVKVLPFDPLILYVVLCLDNSLSY